MPDEIEQKTEVAKIQPPSDSLAKPSVIRTREEEAIWEQMQQKDTKHESATHIGLSPEVIKELEARGLGQKLTLFDSKAEEALAALQKPQTEQTLIASNVAPTVPNLQQMQQYEDIQSDMEPPKLPNIAHSLDGYMPPPTLVPSLEQLGITKETTVIAAEFAKQTFATWTSEHPIAGMETELMKATTDANPHAWENAAALFSQLNGISPSLMQAYVRNELAHYGWEDHKQDVAAQLGQDGGWTLGMSQITTEGIRKFEKQYPQFRQFLESKGYSGPGHELKALLDADCVPMIVAAKTASLVDDLHKHGIKNPTNEQLAYAYNPDVYSYSDGHGGRVYKTLYHPDVELSKLQHWDQRKEYYANNVHVLQESQHVRNVMAWMRP
jgi:hypothetical protein